MKYLTNQYENISDQTVELAIRLGHLCLLFTQRIERIKSAFEHSLNKSFKSFFNLIKTDIYWGYFLHFMCQFYYNYAHVLKGFSLSCLLFKFISLPQPLSLSCLPPSYLQYYMLLFFSDAIQACLSCFLFFVCVCVKEIN